ncbi:MAG TPA: amino acid adenylation domain-containing protein [Pyrinomonadaceae bacterium]|nr:amino acid adenylation domain-containing protein [Pyrinomonadaceae bacterium]
MITKEQKTFLSTAINQSDEAGDVCVHHLFEAQVERTPDSVAATFEESQLTYRELNGRANQLARYLRRIGVGPDALCGIYVERSLEMLVGMLGILKAGGAYVPLDPEYPQERLSFMLEDSRLEVLLTKRRLVERLQAHPAQTVCLDTEWQIISGENVENPNAVIDGQNLVYLIYTSGSTGRPKGVMIEHRSLTNYLCWCTNAYSLADGCGTPVHTPLGFDLTITSLLAPLLTGKRVVLLPEEKGVTALADSLRNNQDFSVVKLTPSHLELLGQMLKPEEAAGGTRAFVIGGEALRGETLRFWRTHAPEVKLFNEYGPTETVVGCSVYELKNETLVGETVPIGCAISGSEIYLLDEELQPVPFDAPGEIYIGGKGLARGYLRRPDLTATRFIPHPFSTEAGARLYRTGDSARRLPDGNLEFLGRIDRQVKIHGYRIELGEVETRLLAHAAVREATVVAREGVSGEKQLVAYVVLSEQSKTSHRELRHYLEERLPQYMIPATFVLMDKLPLTLNGKVDERALPTPEFVRDELEQEYVAPRTIIEQRLVEIWSEILGVKQVGVSDNFFELGGDSLLAVNLLVKIHEVFGKNFSASILIREATIEYLAGVIASSSGMEFWSTMVEIQAEGTRTPFFLVHDIGGDIFGFGPLARLIGLDQPFYGLQARGLDGIQEPFTEMETMAAYYVEEILKMQPEGPILLGGYSLGGVIAFEMAQQLHDQGHQVAFLAVLDEPSPISNGLRKVSPGAIVNVARNFPHWLRDHVWRRSAAEVFADVQRRLGSIVKKSARRIFSPFGVKPYEATVAEVMDMEQLPESRRRVMEALYQAVMNYSPRVYPGRITLFRTRAQPLVAAYGKDKGWGKLAAQGVEIRIVSGNHRNMYEEPHAHILAQEMRAALKAVQE